MRDTLTKADEAMRLADAWVVEAIHAALAAHTGCTTGAKPEAARQALADHLAALARPVPALTANGLTEAETSATASVAGLSRLAPVDAEARELPDTGEKPPLFEAWMDEPMGVQQGGENFPRRAGLAQREYILCRVAWKAALASAGQADARDTGRLDFMQARRVSLIPEFEGPWDASIYDDDGVPCAIFTGGTPREALDAAMRAKEGS